MAREMYEIDFYKELKLAPPSTGLVNKILSPKGIRKSNQLGRYEYRFKDELIQIYDGKPAKVEDGIYWVMSIYKDREENLKWNHYLIIVGSDSIYPVAEFLDCKDSTWIKDAIPYLKDYFGGFDMEPIQITEYKPPKQKKSGWKTSY